MRASWCLLAALILVAVVLSSCAGGVMTTPAAAPSATAAAGEPIPTPAFGLRRPRPTPANGAGPRYGGTLYLANRGDPPSGFDSMRTSSIALHEIGGALFGDGNLARRCRENADRDAADGQKVAKLATPKIAQSLRSFGCPPVPSIPGRDQPSRQAGIKSNRVRRIP